MSRQGKTEFSPDPEFKKAAQGIPIFGKSQSTKFIIYFLNRVEIDKTTVQPRVGNEKLRIS